jgi:hypothetical protein
MSHLGALATSVSRDETTTYAKKKVGMDACNMLMPCYNRGMKDRNNNRAEVRLDASNPSKLRFDVQVFGGDTDKLLAEDSFLGWGGLRLRNFLLFSGVNHVRYMDAETLKAAGLS